MTNKKKKTELSLNDLQQKVNQFVDERDWRKHQNPKNLAISIMIEAAELAEHFQWDSIGKCWKHKNDPVKKDNIAMELADVLIYCLSFAESMNIDPAEAILKKLEYNETKFPKSKEWGLKRVGKRHSEYRLLHPKLKI